MLIRKMGQPNIDNVLVQMAMHQLGFGPVGEIRMLSPGSGNAHNYYRGMINDANFHTYISKAEAAMVSGRNDVCVVLPGSNPWRGDLDATAAALTWDKSNTHLVGLDPADAAGYNRARFSHSGYTMANFMTVSGDCNLFKNLRWMHGSSTGGAADVTCITVNGAGNRFENCGFAGPNDATQAASANYNGVIVSGSHNYFKNCMFGSQNDVDRSNTSSVLKFATTCSSWNVFENCLFRSRSGGGQATAYFINDAVTDTVVDYTAIFLNCQFLHQGTALTYAILKANNASRKLYFDARCTFANVGDIVNATEQAQIHCGAGGAYSSAATSNLLSSALTT